MWSFFVKSSKFTVVLVLALTLLGTYSMLTIPKESNPEVNIPFATVSTAFPGANAVDVEQFVTNELEDALLGLEDVKEITSSSSLGFSSIAVEFVIGTDIDKRLQDMQEAVNRKIGELPSDAGDPLVQRVSFDDTPIKSYAISGPYTEDQLKNFAEELQSRMERIPGLTEAQVTGGRDRDVRLFVSNARLSEYGVSFDQVVNALRQANSNIPVGTIERDDERYSVRFDGTIDNFSDLDGVIIAASPNLVYLSDVARLVDGKTELESASYLGTKEGLNPAITISIYKQAGGNILDVVDGADKVIDDAYGDFLPENVVVESVDDTAEYIRTDLVNLSSSGLQTTLIVILLILVMLGWRESLLAGISIPLTFLITFIALQAVGYTINFLSLFSLILALGILVDAAIVMTEGIYDFRQQGYAPKESALKAIQQFKAPLISGTVTTVFAFLPMMLTSGIIGEFIKSIPVTVSIVLFASLFVALAVIPTFFVMLLEHQEKPKKKDSFVNWVYRAIVVVAFGLAATSKQVVPFLIGVIILILALMYQAKIKVVISRIEKVVKDKIAKLSVKWKKVEVKRDAFVSRTRNAYAKSIQSFIDSKKKQNKLFATLVVAFILAVSLPAVGILKVDMFPATDDDRVYVDITMPSGTSFEETALKAENMRTYFDERDEIDSYLMSIGSGSSVTGGQGVNRASFVLNLVEKGRPSSLKLVDQYIEDLSDAALPGEVVIQQLGSGPGEGAPVEVTVRGEDLETLDLISADVKAILEGVEGTKDVRTSVPDAPGEIVYSVKRDILGSYGITPMQVASTLRNAVYGTEATTIRVEGDDLDIYVQYDLATDPDAPKDISLEAIDSILIQTNKGNLPLSTFVETSYGLNRTRIEHNDGDRVARVTANVKNGYLAQDVFIALGEELPKLTVPAGYEVSAGGQNEDTDQSFADLGRAMIIGIFLIAALLIWQFSSYRQPLFVISSIPLALIGVLPGLAIIQQPLSFPGMIGVVALAGIVVNNGIILVDRINENRRDGKDKDEAITESCESRLRPILLTTITTVAGLLPLVLTQPSWAPLGYAIIFGLMFSTVLTLYVVPLLYHRFAEKSI